MSAIRTVQAFGRETYVKAHFDRAVEKALDAGLAQGRLRGLLGGIVIFLVFSGIGVILWIGGQDLVAGQISAGDLSSFIFYAVLGCKLDGFLSELAGDLQRAAGAAERIAQLLETKASLPHSQSPQRINLRAKVACEFDGVNFAYQNLDGFAISNVDFSVVQVNVLPLLGRVGR